MKFLLLWTLFILSLAKNIFKILSVDKVSKPCDEQLRQYFFYIHGKFNKEINKNEILNINLENSSGETIKSVCSPNSFERLDFFLCYVDVNQYPLHNINLFLPINPPESTEYEFQDWEIIIDSNSGESNKIASEINCFFYEVNTFTPSSVEFHRCIEGNINFTISGEWKNEDKIPDSLEFPLKIENENNEYAVCEFNYSSRINITCEFEGKGMLNLKEDTFHDSSVGIIKLKGIDLSSEIVGCDSNSSSSSYNVKPVIKNNSSYISRNIIFILFGLIFLIS